MSTHGTTDRFREALARLEEHEELEPLLELFAEDVVVDTATPATGLTGVDGARRLWTEDRALFARVRSDFRNVVVDGDVAILEWRRDAEGHDGRDFSHPGVSVLEVRGDRIVRFAVYFDPTALAHAAD
jgi:ketosteroid isomerase-like protein